MAVFALLPFDRPVNNVQELKEIEKAMITAQGLILKKMPTGEKADKARFEYVTKKLAEVPFLVLDKSESVQRSWKNQKICVRDALDAALPDMIMSEVEPKLSDIQKIIDSAAEVSGFMSFWYNYAEGERSEMQFCILRVPNMELSTFQIFFFDIKANFKSRSMFGISSTTRDMEMHYNLLEFSILTDLLLKMIKENEEGMMKLMRDFLKSVM